GKLFDSIDGDLFDMVDESQRPIHRMRTGFADRATRKLMRPVILTRGHVVGGSRNHYPHATELSEPPSLHHRAAANEWFIEQSRMADTHFDAFHSGTIHDR